MVKTPPKKSVAPNANANAFAKKLKSKTHKYHTLCLKREPFDLIASRNKTVEYRDCTKRGPNGTIVPTKWPVLFRKKAKTLKYIVFFHGYAKQGTPGCRRMIVPVVKMDLGAAAAAAVDAAAVDVDAAAAAGAAATSSTIDIYLDTGNIKHINADADWRGDLLQMPGMSS